MKIRLINGSFRSMRKYVLVALLLSIPVVMSEGQGGYYGCTGPVTGLMINNNGAVDVSGPGGIPWALALCQIGVTPSGNGWSSDSCKAAYAKLLAAQLSGQTVTIWFTTDGYTCSTQPTWTLNNKAYGVV